ncbi:MAG TPA: hypothetical protein VMG10_23865 [Gemmataceae bacterium]|nr:hypothetical protein [Gemmataceae bacterium]
MKRILLVGLVALGLAAAAPPVKANFMFDYSVCRHFCFVHTQKNRCFNFNSCATPLPGAPGGGYAGPAGWGGPPAYGPPPAYGYAAPAPVVAAPAAVAPAAPAPQFKAPQPSPASNSSTGVQQAGYFYYGPTNNAGYGYNYGYGAGYLYYGYGAASYAQVPNYWY